MNDVPHEKKVPIRGWLIPFGVVLWLTPLLQFAALVNNISLPHTGEYVQLHFVTIGFGIVIPIMSIMLLVLFVKRKRSFIKFFLVSQAIVLLDYVCFIAMGLWTGLVAIYTVLALILTLYILRSNRVRNTCIR
jgi:LPXTG-motif cell wall-anchored protein